MKIKRKLPAVLLSVVLLLSTVMVPTNAEPNETRLTQTKNLFDFSFEDIGELIQYPKGISDYRNSYFGSKEIVKLSSGNKGLKIDLTKADWSGSGTNLTGQDSIPDYSLCYGVKVQIPDYYLPYITGINWKYSKDTSASLCYNFGVTDGSRFSKTGPDNDVISGNVTGENVLKLNPEKLYRVLGTGKFGKETEVSELWGDNGYSYLFLVFGASQAVGSITIEELSLTLQATAEQFAAFPQTEKYNLFDLSSCANGAFSAYPSGISDYKNSYTGPKEIVTLEDGDKGLKIDLSKGSWKTDSASNKLAECGYTPWYGVQVQIPTEYIPYIQSVNWKLRKDTNAVICYNFGVNDGSAFSKKSDFNDAFSSSVTGRQEVIYDIDDLYKIPDHWYFGWYGKGSHYSTWNQDFTNVYLVLGASQNTGSIIIEELSVTLKLGSQENIHKTYTEKVNAFDLTHAAAGELTCLPANVTAYNDTYTGTREVVTDAAGQKGLKLDMSAFSGNESANMADGNYGAYFGVEAALPAQWIPYISAVELTLDKQSDAYICYSFGVTDGVYNSKVGETNSVLARNSTGVVDISLSPQSLYKVTRDWDYTHAGAPSGKWGTDFTALYFNFCAAGGATGTLTIKEISYTLTGSAEELGRIKKELSAAKDTVFEGFEETGTVTDYAASGAKALLYKASNSWNTSSYTSLLNANAAEADGMTFWVYNGGDGNSEQKMILNAGGDYFVKRFSIPAHSYRKISIDFNNIAMKVGDNWNWSEGAKTSLTLYQRSNLQYVFFTELHRDQRPIYYDDIRFVYNRITPDVASSGAKTVSANAFANGVCNPTEVSCLPGNENSVVITTESGYEIEDVTALDASGMQVLLNRQNAPDGQNIAGYYTFTMPENNVVFTVRTALTDSTMLYTAKYASGDNFNLTFSLDLTGGTAYNPVSNSRQNLANYGMMAVPVSALEKYGYTENDLTLDFVNQLQQTGNHLGKYIYLLDFRSPDAYIFKKTNTAKDFLVQFNDISIAARREKMAIVSFAEFEDGTVSYDRSITTPDKISYPNLPETFDPDSVGINYCSALEGLSSTQMNHAIFKEATWADIKNQGFEHIRLPVNVNNSLDANGKIVETDFVKIDTALQNAMNVGLPVVLDLHGFKTICSDYEGTKNAFLSVWYQLGERYANLPLSIIFEIINEPSVSATGTADPMTSADLMELEEATVDTVRHIPGNENRTFVLGTETNGYWNFGMFTQSLLNRGNLIIDVHNYSPMTFSHSGAAWLKNEDGTLVFPGGATEFGVEEIKNSMAGLAAFEQKYQIPIWVGEFGAYHPDAQRKVEYFKTFADAMFQSNLGWALWEYGAGWSPYRNGVWDTDLLQALGVQ